MDISRSAEGQIGDTEDKDKERVGSERQQERERETERKREKEREIKRERHLYAGPAYILVLARPGNVLVGKRPDRETSTMLICCFCQTGKCRRPGNVPVGKGLDRETSPTGKGPVGERGSGKDPVGEGRPGKVRSGNARSGNDSLRPSTAT